MSHIRARYGLASKPLLHCGVAPEIEANHHFTATGHGDLLCHRRYLARPVNFSARKGSPAASRLDRSAPCRRATFEPPLPTAARSGSPAGSRSEACGSWARYRSRVARSTVVPGHALAHDRDPAARRPGALGCSAEVDLEADDVEQRLRHTCVPSSLLPPLAVQQQRITTGPLVQPWRRSQGCGTNFGLSLQHCCRQPTPRSSVVSASNSCGLPSSAILASPFKFKPRIGVQIHAASINDKSSAIDLLDISAYVGTVSQPVRARRSPTWSWMAQQLVAPYQ